MTSAYINHLTLTTGHLRRSYRTEVSDAVITIVAQDLATARAGLPYQIMPGYVLEPADAGGVLLCTVFADSAGAKTPLVTIGVAGTSLKAAGLWRVMTDALGDLPPRPPAPVCAVWLHAALDDDLAAAAWLGDYERCLAWAWLE